MANNLAVTPGTGATVAAEDIGGIKYSLAKLMDASAGATLPIGVTSNPLQVALPSASVTTLTPLATLTALQGNAPWSENISQVGGVSYVLGQANATLSLPVVLPSAQITTLTPLAPLATLTALQGGNWNMSAIGGTLTAYQGGTWNVLATLATLPVFASQAGVWNVNATISGQYVNLQAAGATLTTGVITPPNAGLTIIDTAPNMYYNPSLSAMATLSFVNFQSDANGNLKDTLNTLLAGENLTTNRLNNEPIYSYANITTNTTTVVRSGAGTFHGFTVNNNGFTTAGTITITDNTAAGGTAIGTWTIPLEPPGTVLLATTYVPPQLPLDISFATGLTIVTATTVPAPNITVAYR